MTVALRGVTCHGGLRAAVGFSAPISFSENPSPEWRAQRDRRGNERPLLRPRTKGADSTTRVGFGHNYQMGLTSCPYQIPPARLVPLFRSGFAAAFPPRLAVLAARANTSRNIMKGAKDMSNDDKNFRPSGYGDYIHHQTSQTYGTADGKAPQYGGTVYTTSGQAGTVDSWGNFKPN